MNRGMRRIAFILAFVFFTETVSADANMGSLFGSVAEEVQNNGYEFDDEHIEEAIETTSEEIIVPDDAVSEGSILTDIIENISDAIEKKPEDSVLSEAAVDYEIDTSSLPSEAEALLDEYYDAIEYSDRFLLNTYLMVREDTMEECCDEGYTVRESIPYALIMQMMETDISAAKKMMAAYGSQQAACDAAYDGSLKIYDFDCFTDENVVKLFKKYIQDGYEFDSVMNSYAAALCMNRNIEDVIANEIADEENDVTRLAEKYSISISAAEEILSMYTAEEFDAAVGEVINGLKNGNEGISTIADGDQEADADSIHDALNKGPMSYKEGTGASVDPSTGALSYVENICNIPGIAGLDLNINLLYSSSSPIQGRINNISFDKAYNWRYSFPAVVNENGSYMKSGRSPQYLLLPSGGTCEMITETGSRYIPYVAHEKEFKLYYDTNHKGGTSSFYYVEYIDGKTDYFDEQGHWLKTTDRFGNKIEVTKRTESVMEIKDTRGNTITISNDGITKQTVIRPDGSQVVIYFDINNSTLTKIVQPEGLTTEFTYGAASKDNFHSSYITKIKKPSGLEHNFKYGYVVRPKLVKIKNGNGIIIDYGTEDSKYQYGRIVEEYLTADNKTYNKKTYSYENNFMEASFGFNIICNCNLKHNHYYDGMVWRCMMDCSYECNGPYVYAFDSLKIYDYSTTVASEGGTTVKYTYNSRNLNTSIEEYSGSQLINKTEMQYYKDCPLNIPYSVTYTEGNFVKIDAYTYTEHSDISEHKVMDRNYNILSMEKYEYDYGHYGLLIKSVKSMNDSEEVVQNNGLDYYYKNIGESVVTRNGEEESRMTCSYDERGRKKYLTQFFGKYDKIVTEYTYLRNTDPDPFHITVYGTEGELTYNYDELGRVINTTNRNRTSTYYYYDDVGNLTEVRYMGISNSGRSAEYLDYDYAKNIITHTDGDNRKTVYDFDPIGNLVSVTKNGIEQESYTYDSRMRTATHKSGKAVTYYTYDNRDRLTSEIVKEGTKILLQKKYAYEYNSDGLKTTETIVGDSTSKTITNITQSDIMGRDKMVNQAGNITYYTYDMAGNVVKSQNLNGNKYLTNEYTYDHRGNALSDVRTDGTTGDVKKTYATYDLMGRMIASTDGKGNVTEYTYDEFDHLLCEKIPCDPENGSSSGQPYYFFHSYGYDNNGNLDGEYYDGSGISINYQYDYKDRLIKTDSGMEREYYRYDNSGNMTERSNWETFPDSCKYEYDSFNRLVKYTDKLGNSETYEYDSNNDMIKKTDRNGDVTTYTYDGLHRKLTEKGKGFNNSFTYGATGNITEEKNDNAVVKYTYNEKGLTASEETKIGTDTFRINRTYDTRGNLTQNDYYKNNAVYERQKYTYDGAGRLTGVGKTGNSSTSFNTLVTYNYDKNDNISSAHYGNNTYHTYDYNCADMVTAIHLYRKTDNKCLESLEYIYDKGCNISSKLEKYNDYTTETKYLYNSASALIEEYVITNGNKYSINYAYDDAGNRASAKKTGFNGEFQITYNYDKNNRLVSIKEINRGKSYKTDYTYDNNGNQTMVENYRKNDDGVFKLNIEILSAVAKVGNDEKFEYNGLNQLVGYEGLAGTHNGKQGYSAEYKYMPNGYRLSKDVNGKTTKFLWDGDNVAAELNSANAITKSYYRGINLISDSSDNYYMSDAHGDVIETYDIIVDYPSNWYFYNAFGGNDYFDDSDLMNETYNLWGYCGQYYDIETGNYYMRARYYNPHTGRFISEDPIRDGLNWYAYCGNNPVNLTDTNGLNPKDKFASVDEAAIDAGNYYLDKTYVYNEEFCARIYKVDDNRYSYDYLANRAQDKKLAFYVNWGISKPEAVLHTHVFYDENNPNNEFSTPNNSTGEDEDSDSKFAENYNIPLYLAAPTGELKLYIPGVSSYDLKTGEIKNDVLISDKLVVDPKYSELTGRNTSATYSENSKSAYNAAKELMHKILYG